MVSRRAVLTLSSVFVSLAFTSVWRRTSSAQMKQAPEDETRFVEWMDDATRFGKEIAGGTLNVARFKDAYWYLTRGIEWSPNPGQTLPTVSVPIGFVTDFASIPRALWSALPRDGDYVWAAVVHDYLYWYQTTTKEVADDVLNAAMTDFKIPAVQRLAIYEAVRLGGASSWQENARLKAAGEKRTIKLFPPDPTISWEDWKKRSDVF